MITLNEKLVTAQTQNIKFDKLTIEGGNQGDLRAEVMFLVLNELDQVVGKKYLIYAGVDFNDFWSNFNSAAFLYEKLVQKESLAVTVDTQATNESFVNTVSGPVIVKDAEVAE